jgi:putative transposase
LATEKGLSLCGVCRQLGYSKQAYYKSLSRKKAAGCQQQQIKQKVLAVRHQLPRLGTRKLYKLLGEDLRREGLKLGRDGLFALLRQESLLVVRKRKYVSTTDSRGWMRQYPNLAQGMELSRPEQLWVADITYLSTRQGYNYLHLVTDAYSKKIMGYKHSDNLQTSASLQALKMALNQRCYRQALIHHSDRGLQYCSKEYTGLLKENNVSVSMTQNGSPYDNAIAERVNGILKQEFGLDEQFENMQEAGKQIDEAISLYNRLRPHMSNHLLTPDQMHQQDKLKPKAWHKKTTRTLEGPGGFLPSPPII